MPRLILKGLLRLVFRIVFRVRVHGNAHVRADRLLIVANHESFLDELLLCVFLPQRPVIVEYANAPRKRLFRALAAGLADYLTIDPNNPLELKPVIRLLETGRPVLIFPEGRITTTGNLMKTYEGPGFIAARANATILPVRIEGAAHSCFSLLHGNVQRTAFPRIRLFVQEPTRIVTRQAPHSEQHHLAAQSMHRVMTDLMFAGRAEQTLLTALIEAARLHGSQRQILGDIDQPDYTCDDLLRSAVLLGRKLARGLPADARFGVMLPNMASLLALVFGLSAWRRPPALLDPQSPAAQLQAACGAAGIHRIISSRALLAQPGMRERADALAGVEWILLEDLLEQVSIGEQLWWLLWGRFRPQGHVPASRPEDPALVMFTAGTEGRCKGVVLSHRAILSNVSQLRSVLDVSANDVVANALPLQNPFGLTCGALIPLLCGARLFLHPSPQHFRPAPEMAFMAPCTLLLGSNTFLAHYGAQARPFDLHRLRHVISGSGQITEDVRQQWFEKFGARIFEGYGTAETAPVISINTQMAFRSGSAGQFLPSIRHRLTPVPAVQPRHGGQCGRLHVSGPNLMEGYLQADLPGALTPPASPVGPGWHDTGDIVEVDSDGYVYVRGRVRREITIAGQALSLGALELVLAEGHPAHTHAVVATTRSGSNPLGIFTTAPGLAADAAASAFAAAGIELPARLLQIFHRPTLPLRGARDHIDYHSLRATLEADQATNGKSLT